MTTGLPFSPSLLGSTATSPWPRAPLGCIMDRRLSPADEQQVRQPGSQNDLRGLRHAVDNWSLSVPVFPLKSTSGAAPCYVTPCCLPGHATLSTPCYPTPPAFRPTA